MNQSNDVPTLEFTFAKDYINHKPSQFSMSKLTGPNGEIRFVISFIDHEFIPNIIGENHQVKFSPRIRSTIDVPKEFVDSLIQVSGSL